MKTQIVMTTKMYNGMRKKLFPPGSLAGLEWRGSHVDDDTGALLGQHRDRVRPVELPPQRDGVPDILSNADADLATRYFNALWLRAALEVTRLVEDVIRRQERLDVHVLHLAVGEQGCGVLDRPA